MRHLVAVLEADQPTHDDSHLAQPLSRRPGPYGRTTRAASRKRTTSRHLLASRSAIPSETSSEQTAQFVISGPGRPAPGR
jgi:hypothetical protein